MCIRACVCACVCACVYGCLSVCISVFLSVCLPVHVTLHVCVVGVADMVIRSGLVVNNQMFMTQNSPPQPGAETAMFNHTQQYQKQALNRVLQVSDDWLLRRFPYKKIPPSLRTSIRQASGYCFLQRFS